MTEGKNKYPGTKNLIPIKTSEEAREKGRKGGKASGETRRRKQTFQLVIQALLDMPLNEKAAEKIKAAFPELADDVINYRDAINIKQLEKAIVDGDLSSAIFIRDTAGEMPPKQLDISAQVRGIDISFECPEENHTDLEDELDTQKDALEKQE